MHHGHHDLCYEIHYILRDYQPLTCSLGDDHSRLLHDFVYLLERPLGRHLCTCIRYASTGSLLGASSASSSPSALLEFFFLSLCPPISS
jgi:hypothetical protein